MTYTIAHLWDANCRNWGEKLVGECTIRLLSRVIPFDNRIIYAEETMPDDIMYSYPHLSDNLSELQKANLFLIGGGGCIGHLAGNENILDIIKSLPIPKIAFSVGWNRVGLSSRDVLSSSQKYQLENISNQCKFFSVRADTTKENLEEFGLSFPESSDPAIWSNELFPNIPSSPFQNPYIVICIGGDYRYGRFTFNNVNIDKAGDIFRDVVSYIIQNTKLDVVILHHRVMDHFFDEYLGVIGSNRIKYVQWYKAMEQPLEYILSIYKHATMIITSRGHGIYSALSFDVPFIAISDQPKIEGIMKKMGFLKEYADIRDPNLAETLINIRNTIDTKEMKKQMIEVKRKKWLQTEKQLEKIGELLR